MLLYTLILVIGVVAATSTASGRFFLVHEPECSDNRTVGAALHDFHMADFKASEERKVPLSEREHLMAASRDAIVAELSIHLRDQGHSYLLGPNPVFQRRISELPLETRRHIFTSLMHLKAKSAHKEATQLRKEVEAEGKKVSFDFLKHLDIDIVEGNPLQGDRVIKMAHAFPCLHAPPVRDGPRKLLSPDSPFLTAVIPNEGTPQDLTRLWHLAGPDQGVTGGINMLSAWSCTTGRASDKFVVGVIDTGCSMNPDLLIPLCSSTESCAGYDHAGENNNPFAESLTVPHGTSVCSCIAGTPNNSFAAAGACPHCRISCNKAAGEEGLMVGYIIRAVDYILAAKTIKITNHSYGGNGNEAELRAHQRMQAAGILNVIAAGNEPCNSDLPGHWKPHGCTDNLESGISYGPSGYRLDNFIVVGGLQRNGDIYPDTTWGPTTVHVMAPAEYVPVAVNTQLLPPDTVGAMLETGTSFAAPLVAGMTALLWSQRPELSYREIRKAVFDTVRKDARYTRLCSTGGVVDAAAAMQRLQIKCDGPDLDTFPQMSMRDDKTRYYYTMESLAGDKSHHHGGASVWGASSLSLALFASNTFLGS